MIDQGKEMGMQQDITKIENGTEKIEKKEYLGNRNLYHVYLPESILTLEDWCFAYCKNLQTVWMPRKVVLTGRDVFLGCDKLSSVYIYDKEYIYEEFSENLAFGIKNFLKGDRFDFSVFGTTEWFCRYDEQLAIYINEPDEANFEPFLAGGEEDYEDPSNNIESFCRQKRTNKIKGIFFRLRVENKDRVTGKIDSDRKKDWVSYIKRNEKETLEFLKERKEEAVTYFKIMKEERILTAGNISYFIDGMAGSAFTESKAYLLKEQENLSVEDVWKQFQI